VSDKLEDIFKNSRKEFEEKWNDIRIFILYGMISDEKFLERAKKFALLRNTEDKYFTFEEYENHIGENQKNKDGKLVYLYTTDTEEQHAYLGPLKDRGYDILVFDGPIDSHFINLLEHQFENTVFARVDSNTIDKIIEKEENGISLLSDDEKTRLKEYFETVADKQKFSIQPENLSREEMPVVITRPEFMRRMKDMAAVSGGMDYLNQMPEQMNIVVNTNHALAAKILAMDSEETRNETISQLIDLALLSQGMLKGEALTNFVKRSVSII
jgi:molecular chaperone HtpG